MRKLLFLILCVAISSCSPAYYQKAKTDADTPQTETITPQIFEEPPAPQEAARYIVFFAGAQTLSAPVAAAIKNSQSFFITLPIYQTQNLRQDTSELLFSYRKAEPALAFTPEPYFPLLTSSFKADNKKYMKSLFESDIENFIEKTYYKNFGIYLADGIVSASTLDYFELLKANWTVAYNIEAVPQRVFKHNNITVFAPYADLPVKETQIAAWLAAKNDAVIPVLLKPAHLNNAQFMRYLINMFDKHETIKPATPLFITKNTEISKLENLVFKTVEIPQEFVSKAYATSEIVEKYKNSSSYKKESYDNIKSELYSLYSYEVLSGLIKDSYMSKQMYDIAYANIYRLLGINPPENDDISSVKFATEKVEQITAANGTLTVNGDGALNKLIITSRQNTTDFSLKFAEGADWPINISYIDVYINQPYTDGAVEMVPPTTGVFEKGSAWKYMLRIYPDKTTLYRRDFNETREITSIPILNKYVAKISKTTLNSAPEKWGVQAVSVNAKTTKPYIVDFFVKKGSKLSKEDLLSKMPFTTEVLRAD